MNVQEALALLAALCGLAMGLGPLLQAVRVLRRRRADDVSAVWLGVIVAGAVTWLAYGLTLGNWAIIAPNAVGVLASSATLVVVLGVRRRRIAAAP